MYEIQPRFGNQWAVVDGHQGRTMCIAPLHRYEGWLDCRDNECSPWAGVLGQKLYVHHGERGSS